MLRLWLRLVVPLLLLSGALVAGVRARPAADAPSLRAFFIPPAGCAAPCWLGIRPGVTTVDEALALLHAHEWVAGVRQSGVFYDLQWSGSQPAWIDSGFHSHFRANGRLVDAIRIRTTLPNGLIFALLGQPDSGVINTPLNQAGLRHTARYEHSGAEISSLTACPMRRDSVWHTPVEVRYRSGFAQYRPYHYTRADWWALRPCR
jgi:hypothetical protein